MKSVYYAAAFGLLFLPQTAFRRGGASSLFQGLGLSDLSGASGLFAGSVLFSGAVAFLAALPLAGRLFAVLHRFGSAKTGMFSLVVIVLYVSLFAGLGGLLVTLLFTALGLFPVFSGCRRLNALGVIMLPVALQLSGLKPVVLQWLGLGS